MPDPRATGARIAGLFLAVLVLASSPFGLVGGIFSAVLVLGSVFLITVLALSLFYGDWGPVRIRATAERIAWLLLAVLVLSSAPDALLDGLLDILGVAVVAILVLVRCGPDCRGGALFVLPVGGRRATTGNSWRPPSESSRGSCCHGGV